MSETFLYAIAVMALGAVLLGAMLGFAAVKFRVEGDPLVEKIDSILPQTQCGQCGYPGCKPYAEAIASGEAEINQCPPGGDAGARALADLQRQSGAASSADLETILGQFQAAAPATQGPSAIEYVAGELRLKNVAKADEWDATATRLRAAGYEARLEGDSVVMKQERRP